MKKILLILAAGLVFTGCEIEEDGPLTKYDLAKVKEIDLPETFERGKVYNIEVTYLLPTACHTPTGLEVNRGGIGGAARRDIYVVGVAGIDASLSGCDREEEDAELEREATFRLPIDESEPYIFYLWKGFKENMESEYITVEVPVTGGNTIPE